MITPLDTVHVYDFLDRTAATESVVGSEGVNSQVRRTVRGGIGGIRRLLDRVLRISGINMRVDSASLWSLLGRKSSFIEEMHSF